jgi:hypothetical protein
MNSRPQLLGQVEFITFASTRFNRWECNRRMVSGHSRLSGYAVRVAVVKEKGITAIQLELGQV